MDGVTDESINRTPRDKIKLQLVSEIDYPSVPEYQRVINHDQVNKIYDTICEELRLKIEPRLTGCLVLFREPDNTISIADGNHRLTAYRKILQEKGKDLKVYVQIIDTFNRKDSETLFDRVNTTTPLTKLPDGISQSNVNCIIHRLNKEYSVKGLKDVINNAKGTRLPRIYNEDFKEHLAHIISVSKYSVEYITSKIIDYNNELNMYEFDYFKEFNSRLTEAHFNTADKLGCRLGLAFVTDRQRPFTELYKIFNVPYKEDTKYKFKRVTPVKALRQQVWNVYCGLNRRESTCPFCDIVITFDKFHCAHDIAHADGGSMTIDNLYPCCDTCNLSLGKQTFAENMKMMKGLTI